jgi:hypothetical protein
MMDLELNYAVKAFNNHKGSWSPEEKKMVHDMLNEHHITDGVDNEDVAMMNLMCMIYVDGIRDGRRY